MADLYTRLREAALWLGSEVPDGTRKISDLPQDLGEDVHLDELDLYCVNLMLEAASAVRALAGERDEARQFLREPIHGAAGGFGCSHCGGTGVEPEVSRAN